MSIRQRNAHFTDWAAVCRALNVATESEARTALESSDNPFYYYVCYIKSTKEIYTHGQFYNCSGNEDLLYLIQDLTEEVTENEEVTARALAELSDNKASRGEVELLSDAIKASREEVELLSDAITELSSGGIAIVDSADQLDPSAKLGSLASVVEPGSIKESSFRDLYQPDASMINPDTSTLTAPELLSSVSSVSVFAPQNVDSLVESGLYLVSRDFSMTSQNMAMVQIVPQQGVTVMTMTEGYDTMKQFVLAEYSQDTMSYTIHNDQVEAFNAILANGMDWCYFANPEGGITEEQFATIDLFIKGVAGIPSKAHVYLKKDNWEELYAKDFEKLASNIDKVETSVNAKADKMPIESYDSRYGLKPNVYTTYTISYSGSFTIKLADIVDSSTYNEYIIEIKCTSTPSSVVFKDSNNTEVAIKWANSTAPVFGAGTTYLISIANGFGVYSMFPNS